VLWWALLAALVVLVVYAMLRIAKRIDGIEDDASYIYEGEQSGGYGSKFLNILRGRSDD
jgi:hypothetical protein